MRDELTHQHRREQAALDEQWQRKVDQLKEDVARSVRKDSIDEVEAKEQTIRELRDMLARHKGRIEDAQQQVDEVGG